MRELRRVVSLVLGLVTFALAVQCWLVADLRLDRVLAVVLLALTWLLVRDA